MTISNQDGRSGPFNGTSSDGGSTGTFTFAYDFKVLDQSHLVVTVTTTSTGAAVTKTITTDYTVTGVGTDSGGNVTFVAGKAPLSTETVTITRAVPLTQLTDLQNRGGVQPSVLEESFDKLTQITQDTKEVQARTLRFPVASTLSGIEMPLTATNDAVLAWSSDGTKLVNGPTSGQISSAESSATAAAASACIFRRCSAFFALASLLARLDAPPAPFEAGGRDFAMRALLKEQPLVISDDWTERRARVPELPTAPPTLTHLHTPAAAGERCADRDEQAREVARAVGDHDQAEAVVEAHAGILTRGAPRLDRPVLRSASRRWGPSRSTRSQRRPCPCHSHAPRGSFGWR